MIILTQILDIKDKDLKINAILNLPEIIKLRNSDFFKNIELL
jgi:hypothetical protein